MMRKRYNVRGRWLLDLESWSVGDLWRTEAARVSHQRQTTGNHHLPDFGKHNALR